MVFLIDYRDFLLKKSAYDVYFMIEASKIFSFAR